MAAKLRAAGAIVFKKTDTSQWPDNRGIYFYNSRNAADGRTRGACYLDQNLSGISSGFGVGVLIGLAFATLATSALSSSQFNFLS